MQEMMNFTSWFLGAIPDFLMSDAIMPLWALMLLGYIVRLFLDLKR